jgi:hypothetical protein
MYSQQLLPVIMRKFVWIILLLVVARYGVSLTSKCTQNFEFLAKTDRVLWIALDVDGECHYSHLIQLVMTDSIVLEVPPTILAKFKGWDVIKEAIGHFQVDVPIRLEKTGGRWQTSLLSWSVNEAPSSPSLLDQYEKFNEHSGSFDGRRWNQVMGRAGLELPEFDGIDMTLIYAFPAGLYLNYKISGVFFFEGSGNLLIFTQQEIDVFHTVLDNNGLSNGSETTFHGIYADYSSDIALGSRTWDEDLSFTGGFNTVKNNHGAGIYVGNSSLALLGDIMALPKITVYRAGNNSIHNNGTLSGTYSGKEVYNATSTTVEANENYWGGTPTSSQFFGPSDYTNWLSSPPTGTSIAGLPPGDDSSILLTKNGLSHLSGDDDDTVIKKEIIQNLRALIAQSPGSTEAVSALMTIFSFIRTDRNDRLGERNGIYGYLHGLSQAHGQLEIGRRALQLMIIERLGRENFAKAIEHAQTALAKFSGEMRQEVMSLLIRLLLRTGEIAKAQQLFDAYKTDYPDDVNMHELLQGMFDHAEHDLAHSAPANGGLPRPSTNPDVTESSAPREFSLAQNFPNPFNPATEIRYALPQAGKVTLKIFNMLGEQVRVLIDDYKPAGQYTTLWDGKDSQGNTVASGIYLYQISYLSSKPSAQTIVRSGKMSLLR